MCFVVRLFSFAPWGGPIFIFFRGPQFPHRRDPLESQEECRMDARDLTDANPPAPYSIKESPNLEIAQHCQLCFGSLSQKGPKQSVRRGYHQSFAQPDFSARKKSTNPNFRVWIFSGGVGVFHVKGWGPKSSACPSKPGKSNFFGGISRDFAGYPGGARKD